MAPDAAAYQTTPGAPGLADFGKPGDFDLPSRRVADTLEATTEAATVFAVFEGWDFGCGDRSRDQLLVNDRVAAEMQGRELLWMIPQSRRVWVPRREEKSNTSAAGSRNSHSSKTATRGAASVVWRRREQERVGQPSLFSPCLCGLRGENAGPAC
jgi:hypothetical protein